MRPIYKWQIQSKLKQSKQKLVKSQRQSESLSRRSYPAKELAQSGHMLSKSILAVLHEMQQTLEEVNERMDAFEMRLQNIEKKRKNTNQNESE